MESLTVFINISLQLGSELHDRTTAYDSVHKFEHVYVFSLHKYHTTPRNIPEERRSHQHRGGSLKPRLYIRTSIVAVR
jgi:hypothetical protein